MALTASLSLTVPALPDNDVWFANSAAWTNYWHGITMSADFTPAATTVYVPQTFIWNDNNATSMIIDGVETYIINKTQFDALLLQLNTLDQCVQDMRTQLKTAGYIDNAQ